MGLVHSGRIAEPAPSRVGVRALKQNASEVLARVKTGETIEVTERGRPVARLTPIQSDRYLELVEAGIITPPRDADAIFDSRGFQAYLRTHRERLRAQNIPVGNRTGLTMQQILDEQRSDR